MSLNTGVVPKGSGSFVFIIFLILILLVLSVGFFI